MAAPVYSVGQVLANTDCNLWFVPIASYKTSGTGRTTTTPVIDPDLQITLAPNSIYEVRASIVYQVTGGTTGLQWGWTFPSGVGGGYTAAYTQTGPTAGTFGFIWSAAPTGAAGGGGTVFGLVILGLATTGASGGTLGFNWSCITGGAGTMNVGAGSYLIARRAG